MSDDTNEAMPAMDYPEPSVIGSGSLAQMGLGRQSPGRVTLRKELQLEAAALERALKVKRELLKLLDDNPVIERFMDLSRGVGL